MSKNIVIKVENLSKLYLLNEYHQTKSDTLSGTLLNSLKQAKSKISKKELKEFWALKDVSFEIEQGDRVGIIGRNGAGKSTLLKILSRITPPTSGRIEYTGKMASLLEVGTGFHGDLSGRENIYLNGSVLGMNKQEINRKFDEIVAFSGIERHLDTPVKKYSSGMYVRLAFAVAAHLEPDILIVDEVLAVGDAEFQKKCLGKMKDVSGQGRTVLFVSHNMAAVENLCNVGVYLDRGKVSAIGKMPDVINSYLSNHIIKSEKLSEVKNRKGSGDLFFTEGSIFGVDTDDQKSIESFSDFKIELNYQLNNISILDVKIDIGINNYMGDRVAFVSSNNISTVFDYSTKKISFLVKNNPLAPGNYNCNIYCEVNGNLSDWLQEVLPFEVVEKDYYKSGKLIPANQGNILLNYSVIN